MTSYAQCYGCKALFIDGEVPGELHNAVVPMTCALNPGAWYTALSNYKTFQPGNGAVLASVVFHFLQTNRDAVNGLLGGPPSFITVVPSKRGIEYGDQPLRKAVGMIDQVARQMRPALRYRGDITLGRRQYLPGAFEQAGDSVQSARVVLVEDTWVTGATALSAAGALLDMGAQSVGVFPIARLVNENYWGTDHPFRAEMNRVPYDPGDASAWPR